MPGSAKRSFIRDILADFQQRYRVVTLAEHARKLRQDSNLAVHSIRVAGELPAAGPATAARPEPALMEVRP
jgi:hypothetical protein